MATTSYTVCMLQGLDLVIYGDSISENWRGTSTGLPYTRQENGTSVTDNIDFVAPDMRATFFQTLGYQYKTAVMAIAGVLLFTTANFAHPLNALCY